MLSKVKSYGLTGLNGYEVDVEVDVNHGLPGIEMVGLPDTAIKESKERVRSAIKNSAFKFTFGKVTINLAPADVKKEGPLYDFPIAMAILAATQQIDASKIRDTIFIGELSLDGGINRVRGILPILLAAVKAGYKKIAVPWENRNETIFVKDIEVFAFGTLREAVAHYSGENVQTPIEKAEWNAGEAFSYGEDLKYVKGQFAARRALEIAAAGGHNILMVGPPGGGKTMLARCLPTILPDMTPEEALETTKIHSVAGCLDGDMGLVMQRPFRSPHHTASRIALTGGGNNARPGEISLAHNGVLFMDELPEYPRNVLEILRQPLESHEITISRAQRSVCYPANFMLVASMNPCPCGNYGSSRGECTCTPAMIERYLTRVSGPLMDRIDLHIEVDNVTYDDLTCSEESEDSASVKERVNAARRIQEARYSGSGVHCNATMSAQMIRKYCALDEQGQELLKSAFDKLDLSARAYTRILKVARTIADLAGSESIGAEHIAEAIQYRSMDRRNRI